MSNGVPIRSVCSFGIGCAEKCLCVHRVVESKESIGSVGSIESLGLLCQKEIEVRKKRGPVSSKSTTLVLYRADWPYLVPGRTISVLGRG